MRQHKRSCNVFQQRLDHSFKGTRVARVGGVNLLPTPTFL